MHARFCPNDIRRSKFEYTHYSDEKNMIISKLVRRIALVEVVILYFRIEHESPVPLRCIIVDRGY